MIYLLYINGNERTFTDSVVAEKMAKLYGAVIFRKALAEVAK